MSNSKNGNNSNSNPSNTPTMNTAVTTLNTNLSWTERHIELQHLNVTQNGLSGVVRWWRNLNDSHHTMTWSPVDAKGQELPYEPKTALSLTDMVQSDSGLNLIARFIAGEIYGGNGKVILTAPAEKFGYTYGTGKMGWVFGDADVTDFTFGTVQAFPDLSKQSPKGRHSVQGLFLDMGEVKLDPVYHTADSDYNGQGIYWFAIAARALLEGANLSIGVGPNLLVKAEGIAAMFNAPDIAVANAARRFGNREQGRLASAIAQDAGIIRVQEQLTGKPVQVSAASLMVPLENGGMFDLVANLPALHKNGAIITKKFNTTTNAWDALAYRPRTWDELNIIAFANKLNSFNASFEANKPQWVIAASQQ